MDSLGYVEHRYVINFVSSHTNCRKFPDFAARACDKRKKKMKLRIYCLIKTKSVNTTTLRRVTTGVASVQLVLGEPLRGRIIRAGVLLLEPLRNL